MREFSGKRMMAQAQLGLSADLRRMFEALHERVTGIIGRYADIHGRIPPGVQTNMRRDVELAIRDMFVVPGTRTVYASDGVTALTEYARILNLWYVRTVADAVAMHRDWMIANMPDDLVRWLTTTPPRPLVIEEMVREEARPELVEYAMFYNNPLAQIDPTRRWVPMHRWNDPNGYRLSDRIWLASDAVRKKIDALLARGLIDGRSALELSRALEAYLLPQRVGMRTLKPYGRRFMPGGASYDAMRLARTEIARAHNYASYLAAAMNPYVGGMDVARSLAGDRKCAVCASHASIDLSGQRVRPPYTLGGAPVPPNHPHCVTPGQMVTTDHGDVPIENIQAGDYVLTHAGKFKRVTKAWGSFYNGIVYKISTQYQSLELTPEHPVLTRLGWVNAQELKAGDDVVNTRMNVLFNSILAIAKGSPSQIGQSLITTRVPFGVMPSSPVAFYSNFFCNKRNINAISQNWMFTDKSDPSFGQSLHHKFFKIGGDTIESVLSNLLQSGRKPWIVTSLRFRYFLANVWAASRIFIASYVTFREANLAKNTARCGRTLPIISLPALFDAFRVISDRDVQVFHDTRNHSISQAKHPGNFHKREASFYIKSFKNLFRWLSSLGFNPQDMPLLNGNLMRLGVIGVGSNNEPSANWTLNGIRHGDFLLPRPDFQWGDDSGRSFVREIASLSQALFHHSTIEEISTREYSGLVYNMSVEDDESYTVNGVAVHNCKCHLRPVVTQSTERVTADLRAYMQQGVAPVVNPINGQAFLLYLLGAALAALVSQEKE